MMCSDKESPFTTCAQCAPCCLPDRGDRRRTRSSAAASKTEAVKPHANGAKDANITELGAKPTAGPSNASSTRTTPRAMRPTQPTVVAVYDEDDVVGADDMFSHSVFRHANMCRLLAQGELPGIAVL